MQLIVNGFLGLATAVPINNALVELNYSTYSRKFITVSGDGKLTNDGLLAIYGIPANTIISSFGVFNALVGGNLLFYFAPPAPINASGILFIPTGDLTLSLNFLSNSTYSAGSVIGSANLNNVFTRPSTPVIAAKSLSVMNGVLS